MKIAIDVSPLKVGHFLQHRVRGTGFYIENLVHSMKKNFPRNEYTLFTRGETLPKDVSVIHNTYFEPFFLTIPLNNLHKTVITVHDLTPIVFSKEFPAGIKGNLRWNIQKFLLKKSAAIITDSESSKKDIVKHTGISENKVHVVYLAAGEEFKNLRLTTAGIDVLRKKYKLPKQFVLYVGDVTWNKNLPRLVKAVQQIQIPLVIVGQAIKDKNFDRSNPWNKDLAEVQDLIQSDSKITCLGFVPKEDLVGLYNIATVFAMPSLYEGFGLPVLEALQCGVPVVTSRCGSLPEIAGDAVRYVQADNMDDIAFGIKEVIENSDLREDLQKKGLVQAEKFSWEKTAKETMEVYETLY